jgi:hypothetical protein
VDPDPQGSGIMFSDLDPGQRRDSFFFLLYRKHYLDNRSLNENLNVLLKFTELFLFH